MDPRHSPSVAVFLVFRFPTRESRARRGPLQLMAHGGDWAVPGVPRGCGTSSQAAEPAPLGVSGRRARGGLSRCQVDKYPSQPG